MTAPLRTGLLGFGLAGRVFHAPLIASNDDFELTHIVTSDPSRQERAGQTYPAALILDRPDLLWDAADDLDLIVIASPPTAHLEQGLRALGAGCAVVIDKPFALTSADAEVLRRAAAEAGKLLAVFQNRRWDGDFLTVRSLLADGALGDVHTFRSSFERSWPLAPGHWRTSGPSEGTGILFDIGAHLIDQALQLFGEVDEATGELRILDTQGGSDDSAFVSLRHRSGTRSHLFMSRFAALGAPRFHILGTRGAYRVEGIDGQEAALDAGVSPTASGYGASSEAQWGILNTRGSSSRVPTMRGDYPAFYEGVAAALIRGAPSPVTTESAARTLQIIEHLYSDSPIERWASR